MTTAKIEIKARNVNSLGDNAQHMYIVYTNEAGEEKTMGGFPSLGDKLGTLTGMLVGDLEVVDIDYNNDSLDWDELNTHPSQLLLSGTDSETLTLKIVSEL